MSHPQAGSAGCKVVQTPEGHQRWCFRPPAAQIPERFQQHNEIWKAVSSLAHQLPEGVTVPICNQWSKALAEGFTSQPSNVQMLLPRAASQTELAVSREPVHLIFLLAYMVLNAGKFQGPALLSSGRRACGDHCPSSVFSHLLYSPETVPHHIVPSVPSKEEETKLNQEGGGKQWTDKSIKRREKGERTRKREQHEH